MKNFFTKIGGFFRSIRWPRWSWIKKSKTKGLALKIGLSILILVILLISLYAVGIYKFKWSRYGVKTVAEIIPYPAGFIGAHFIPLSDFYQQKTFVLHFYQATNSAPPIEDELDRQIMNQLVEQKVVEIALSKERLFVSDKEVEDGYKKIIDQNQGEDNVKKMLKDLYGMSVADFKKLIKQKLAMEKFRNEVLAAAHVEHILIKVPPDTKDNKSFASSAQDIINQLNGGANFQELAKKYSQDEASKDKGGDLGWLSRGSSVNDKPMSKEFENGVFSLEVGKYSTAPVLTDLGFEIFLVTEKRGKIDQSYAQWLSEAKSKNRIIKFIGK